MTEPRSWLEANVGKAAVIHGVGLVVGTIVGLALVQTSGATDLTALWIVVKASLVGSFLGIGAALVVAGGIRDSVMTVRGLTWLTFVTAVLIFFWRSVP